MKQCFLPGPIRIIPAVCGFIKAKNLIMEKKFVIMMMFIIMFFSCKTENKPEEEGTPSAINNELTAAEKEAGLMTPEIMWKFGRLGSCPIS